MCFAPKILKNHEQIFMVLCRLCINNCLQHWHTVSDESLALHSPSGNSESCQTQTVFDIQEYCENSMMMFDYLHHGVNADVRPTSFVPLQCLKHSFTEEHYESSFFRTPHKSCSQDAVEV